MGPYISYCITVQSGILCNRSPEIKEIIKSSEISSELNKQRVDFLFSNKLGNDEYSKLIIDDPFSEDLVDSLLVHMKKRSKIVSYFKQGSANISTYEKNMKDYAIEILKSQNSSYKTALKREYNFHNQYLQTLAAIGVFGQILFCYILCVE